MVAIAAALCGLVVVALADARPSTDRAARPNGTTLARQLVSQFRQEQAFAGYFYPLTATCDETTPDGLAYTCVISTTRPVGSPADRPHLEREHLLRPRLEQRAALLHRQGRGAGLDGRGARGGALRDQVLADRPDDLGPLEAAVHLVGREAVRDVGVLKDVVERSGRDGARG